MKRDIARAYVNMKLDAPLPHYVSGNVLDGPLHFPRYVYTLMNDLFLNQKTNKNIRIPYSLKYKHLEKNICVKTNHSVV